MFGLRSEAYKHTRVDILVVLMAIGVKCEFRSSEVLPASHVDAMLPDLPFRRALQPIHLLLRTPVGP